ncbi:transcription factor VIP1-like [Diospyros lotus]|uniref:transcription factor VIP1-like n=1 Tax=Diospyros lotus TaxID=55363 RepID=UPI002259BD7C|nr:transcription factor VIP1-like [Diospyros lotus]
MDLKLAGKPTTAPLPDRPSRWSQHRRAQSEASSLFSDDTHLNNVFSDFNLASLDLLDSATTVGGGNTTKPKYPQPDSQLQSMSVDSNFFDWLDFTLADDPTKCPAAGQQHYHKHIKSTPGSTSSFKAESSSVKMMDVAKRVVGPDELAELALIDPKRAKRILANRESAQRSKERKMKYTNELEKQVLTLQAEIVALSAKVTMFQEANGELTVKNKELKLRLQAMEEQACLQAVINVAMKEEIQRLRTARGPTPIANGSHLHQKFFSSVPFSSVDGRAL